MKKLSILVLLVLLVSGLDGYAQSKTNNVLNKKSALDNYYGEKAPEIISKQEKSANLRSGKQAKPCLNCMSQHAGDGKFSCATNEVEQVVRKKFPKRADDTQFEDFLKRKKNSSFLRSAAGDFIYQIPVIVHVLYYDGQAVGTDHNITAGQVSSQIEVLNEDYRMKTNTRGYNVDIVGGDARIEFVPALYDPQGNLLPEPGINRVKAEEVTDGNSFLDLNSRYINTGTGEWLKKCTSWEPNCYFNIWVAGLSDGLLGYASFPEANLEGIAGLDTPDPEYDGVMIDYRRFGSYEKGPFPGLSQGSMGRSATHEIGHFLGLRHIWGDAPADNFGQYPEGCSYTDYVDDTPNSKQPMYINKPLYLCGEREMIENYMDYSSDHVKNIFTKLQIERMHIVMDNSPRRKQLLSSTVANKSGDKTPDVKLKASSQELHVYDIFSFEAEVERFPGSYKWEFTGGIPATATGRMAGVYYETPGVKQVKLTVENKFGSVTKVIQVNVTDTQPCEVQYASTLSSLTPIMPNFSFGAYLTGHADVYGITYIANRFTLLDNQRDSYISRVEMDFARFATLPTLNVDTTFTVTITEEAYDSIVLIKEKYWENYLVFTPPSVDTPEGLEERRSVSEETIDNIIDMLKASADLTISTEERGDEFIAKIRRPGKVIAQQKIKLSEALKAFDNDKPLVVLLDNPIRPSTEAYYLTIDLDNTYAGQRAYSFDLKAGLSPVNFCWNRSLTLETVSLLPNEWTYMWAPYAMDTKFNGWEVSVLMHLLPIFVDDPEAVALPSFQLPDLVDADTSLKLEVDGSLPSNVASVNWTLTRPDEKTVPGEGIETEFLLDIPGEYDVKLTYVGKDCLQRSVSKQVKVKGISFNITSSEEGYPVYCTDTEVELTVNELFKTGTTATYSWYGGNLNGETGMQQTVKVSANTTFRVDAEDDLGAKHSESITIELKDGDPVAKFKVLTPHILRGDTLEIYISEDDDAGFLRAENLSENISHRRNWEGKIVREFKWFVEGLGDKSFMSSEDNTFYDLQSNLTDLSSSGPGLYRLGLVAVNRKCWVDEWGGSALYDETTAKDTALVYLSFKAQSSFGELIFKADNKKISVVPPPSYPGFVGYTAYAEPGASVTLEAVSDEITSISWVHSYSGQTYKTRQIQLDDVRDNQLLIVNVTRTRETATGKFDFNETLQVMVLLDENAPSGKAVPDFRPHLDYICPGTKVKMINASRNVVDFDWEFEGGVPVEDESNYGISNFWAPNRRYDVPGEYKVKLTVTSFDGTTESLTKTIHVGGEDRTPQLKISTSPSPAPARIVGDTIYVYDGGPFKLIVEGEAIERMLEYETSFYSDWTEDWDWSGEYPPRRLFRSIFTVTSRANGPTYPAIDGMQQIRITALGCNGEEIVKEFYFRLIHSPSIDVYSLEVDGIPQLLENTATLPIKVSCTGTPINMAVKCLDDEIKAGSDVAWYELDANGERSRLLSNEFSITIAPEVNTKYEVVFVNKMGEGFRYVIPVQVGISSNEIRLMNIDLEKGDDNVIELPIGYNTPLIIWVDEVVKPIWTKEGETLVLSDQNALVVEPENGVYLVKAIAASGECTYTARVTVKKNEAPVDPGVDPEENLDEAIQMYPVPAVDLMTIENPYSGTAYLVDGIGRLIRSWNVEPGTFDLNVSNLASGTYSFIVRFGTGKDEKIVRRNFIVVH